MIERIVTEIKDARREASIRFVMLLTGYPRDVVEYSFKKSKERSNARRQLLEDLATKDKSQQDDSRQ